MRSVSVTAVETCRRCGREFKIRGDSETDCRNQLKNKGWKMGVCPSCLDECKCVFIVRTPSGFIKGVFASELDAIKMKNRNPFSCFQVEKHIVLKEWEDGDWNDD